MNRISTIMFDLSEVLIRGLIGIEDELLQILAQPRETILPTFGGDRLAALCRGEMAEDEYVSQILSSEGWAIGKDELKSLIRRNFHHEVEGMTSLVDSLSQHHDLVLVSDHAREWIDYIEQVHPFMSVFQRKVYSFETATTKDNPSCFPGILSALRLKGEECVFTDDNPRNVEQARVAGIHAILFCNRQALESELSAIDIAVDGRQQCEQDDGQLSSESALSDEVSS